MPAPDDLDHVARQLDALADDISETSKSVFATTDGATVGGRLTELIDLTRATVSRDGSAAALRLRRAADDCRVRADACR